MLQRRQGDFQGDEEMQIASHPQLDRHIEGQGIRREDTSATTGTTENALIDSYHDEARERDEELMIPDVRHVVPPKYEDVRMRKDGGPCKKSVRERVLRRKVVCGDREVVI